VIDPVKSYPSYTVVTLQNLLAARHIVVMYVGCHKYLGAVVSSAIRVFRSRNMPPALGRGLV